MRDLKSLWDELAARHRGNATTPRPSGFQLFNRVADDLARAIAEASQLCSLTQSTERFAIQPGVCRECGASGLDHYFTSGRTGETLCVSCFGQRMAEGDHRCHQRLEQSPLVHS